jgi:anti-sigma factor RsiW
MRCRECIDEFLGDYHDGTLPEEQRVEFERHLNECPACVDYVQRYREMIHLSKDALCERLAAIPDGLVNAILASRAVAPDARPDPPRLPST